MVVYIKKRTDFSLGTKADTESYSIPLEAADGESGSAVLTGYKAGEYTNDWLYCMGRVVLLSQAAPKESKLTITTEDPVNAFDRPCIWPETAAGTYGEFIRAALETEYINCIDPAYSLPYISVENTDTTPMGAIKIDDSKLYKLSNIMAQARRAGVRIRFSIESSAAASDTLKIEISTGTGKLHRIVFSDGHSQLSSETYSAETVAKVTVRQEVEPPEEETQAEETEEDRETVYADTDFYLSAEGEISTEIPQNRAAGKWEWTTCKAEEVPEEQARAIFAENIKSHKIEFSSDRRYGLYDKVLLRLNGSVFKTQIVYVGTANNDERYKYKCGELAVTLTDKVRAAGNKATVKNYDNGSSGGGSGSSDELWYPAVSAEGIISWTRSESTAAPASRDIRGPQGEQGEPGIGLPEVYVGDTEPEDESITLWLKPGE